jgi:hypothetical protein
MNGAAWVTNGKFGVVLNFDGSDDYVSLPFIINPSTIAFTASVWIYSDISHGKAILSSFLTGTKLQTTGTISADEWTCGAVTYDGTTLTLTLYLNGQEDGTASGTIESESSGMRVGMKACKRHVGQHEVRLAYDDRT